MTRAQWEAKVLKQVRDNGGFSVHWVTSNQFIAHAADRLEKRGVIKRCKTEPFPWIAMKLVKRRPKASQKRTSGG